MSNRIQDHFEQQAAACGKMGSPFTANLCRLLIKVLDHDTATGRMVLDWPGDPVADALALRLCGGLHALVLDGADETLAGCYPPDGEPERLEAALPEVIARHDARLAAGLVNAPQTNEIARSAALMPGFLEIALRTGLPLAVNEIGSSGGLNLFFDRFCYRYGDLTSGDPAFPAVLAPEMRGTARPDLSGNCTVASRTGNDVAPIDIADPADRLRLRSYIWPDQPERLARLDAAIDVARKDDFSLVEGDAADFVTARLAKRKDGETFVLFHSVVWQYLPEATKAAITDAMKSAGASATPDSPLAWLRMEGLGGSDPFATLSLTLWPDGKTRHLARCDFHCRWIEWLR